MMLEKACFLFLMTMKRNKKDQEIYQSYSLCQNKKSQNPKQINDIIMEEEEEKVEKVQSKKGVKYMGIS